MCACVCVCVCVRVCVYVCATGFAHVVSWRLVHKFWKNVCIAQHQAATPPSLSRGIRSTTVKMGEKLFYLLQNLGLYLRHRRIRHRRSIWVRAIFTDSVSEGSSITFCKKCACSTLKSPFYAAEFFIARTTGHVKCKYG